MSALRANDADPLIEGCVTGEPLPVEEALPPLMAAHRDLVLDRLNAWLQQEFGTDEYYLAFEAAPARK